MSEYLHLIQALKRKPLRATESNGLICAPARHKIDKNVPFCHNVPSVPYNLNVINRNCSIDKIINSIPEITTEIDVPEFVSIGQSVTQKPQNLVNHNNNDKYSTIATNCDENGYYMCDHDYLGFSMIHEETDQCASYLNSDHTYAMTVHPSCLYIDLKQLKLFQSQELLEGKVHMCVYCSRIFSSRRSLIRHSASHRKPETLMETHENEIII